MAVLGHALACLSLFLSLNPSWRGQHGTATLVEGSTTSTKGFPVCRRKEAYEDLGVGAFPSEFGVPVFQPLPRLPASGCLAVLTLIPTTLCGFASTPACSPLTPE